MIVIVNTPFGGQSRRLPVLPWRPKSAQNDVWQPIFDTAHGGSGCAAVNILRDDVGGASQWSHVVVR